VYLATTLLRAAGPLWYDEICTVYIARMPTLAECWIVVHDGMDLNPRLLYSAVHGARKLLGDSEVVASPAYSAFFLPSCASRSFYVGASVSSSRSAARCSRY
jgi:hypothetical protein